MSGVKSQSEKFDIAFFLKHFIFYSGKIPPATLRKITELSHPSYQRFLRKNTNRIRITRFLLTVITFIEVPVQIATLIAIINDQVHLYISLFALQILVSGISVTLGNYVQDYQQIYEPVILESLTHSVTSRNFSKELMPKIRQLPQKIQLITSPERLQPPLLLVFLSLIGYAYVFDRYYDLKPYIVIAIYLLLGLTSLVIAQSMDRLYERIFKGNLEMRNRIQNISQINILKDDIEFKDEKEASGVLAPMTFVKVVSNVYNRSFILILFVILLINDPEVSVITLLIFLMISAPIDRGLFFSMRIIPKSVETQRTIINPLIKELENNTPSPLSVPQPSKQVETGRITSIEMKNLSYTPRDAKISMLTVKNFSLPIQKGLYSVAGDSGEGKSLLLSILGNELFPSTSRITLKGEDGKTFTCDKIGFWGYRQLINYVWITQKEFYNTTPVKLFRLRLLPCERSQYIDGILDKLGVKVGRLSEEKMRFFYNTTRDPVSRWEKNIDKKVERMFEQIFIRSGLFRKNERHVMTTQFSSLSGGQQARVLTALYLTGPQQIILLDEGLERTTQSLTSSQVFTRDRLLSFIGKVVKNSDKTVLLLIQGGEKDQKLVEKYCGRFYLGRIDVTNGRPRLKRE